VLFVFGIASGGAAGLPEVAGGSVVGVSGGVLLGTLLYLGLLRIPMKRLFTVTGWMVLLLAAGLASEGVSLLVQADLLPALGNDVWDTSFLLSEDGLLGRVLHTLVGYVAKPQGIQLVAFAATLIAIGLPMWLLTRPRHLSDKGLHRAPPYPG
jgi:high-affinity iron transporter